MPECPVCKKKIIGDLEKDAMIAFERAREKSHTDSHTEGNQKKEG